jgi:predicted AAA+ superfamily ATPase
MHEQIVYNKKAYAIDTGLAHYNGFRILNNEDKLYENVVAIVLYHLALQGEFSLFYWKDSSNHEIDFIIKKNVKIIALIQVSLIIENEKTKNRELRSLITGSQAFECENLILITKELEMIEEFTWNGITKKIIFIPLWNWLLLDQMEKFNFKL